jgi:uncharacterized membrane protein (DUF4010 family)
VSFDAATSGAVTAVLIGLLLGLERQRSHTTPDELFAGIRTFPLLTLLGYLSVHSGRPWLLAVVMSFVGGLVLVSYVRSSRTQLGATTEVVGLLAPLLGALVAGGEPMLAAASAVVIALLLTLKAPLHRIAGGVSEGEILAILKFGVVAVVLVPLLPKDPIGPWGSIVPRQVGIVVVILCAVSLGAYLLVRLLGSRAGWALAGLLGGLVSSTATTLSFSGKARRAAGLQDALAVGVLLASTILYARGLLLFFFFDRELAAHLLPRLLALFAVSVVLAGWRYRGQGKGGDTDPIALGNPVELGRAVVLAALFAGVLVVARAAQERYGAQGLRLTGFVGGLVDVDSVTVAAAQMHRQGTATTGAAADAYLLATLANLAMKAGMVSVVGGAGLARRVLPAFGVMAALTVALIALA